MLVTALVGTPSSPENSSLGTSRVQRDGIQNRGRGTIPAIVLYLAKLVEGPKERPLKARLVAGELAEGVALLGVGVERAAEEDLVPVPGAGLIRPLVRYSGANGTKPHLRGTGQIRTAAQGQGKNQKVDPPSSDGR